MTPNSLRPSSFQHAISASYSACTLASQERLYAGSITTDVSDSTTVRRLSVSSSTGPILAAATTRTPLIIGSEARSCLKVEIMANPMHSALWSSCMAIIDSPQKASATSARTASGTKFVCTSSVEESTTWSGLALMRSIARIADSSKLYIIAFSYACRACANPSLPPSISSAVRSPLPSDTYARMTRSTSKVARSIRPFSFLTRSSVRMYSRRLAFIHSLFSNA